MKKYGIVQLDGVSSTAKDQFSANGYCSCLQE